MKPGRGGAGTVSDTTFALAVSGVAGALASLWLGAQAASILSGHGHASGPWAAAAALATPGDPAAAWGRPVGPVSLYWGCTVAVLLAVGTGAVLLWLRLRDSAGGAREGERPEGMATPTEAASAAGARALIRRKDQLRPSLDKPDVGDLGHRLGRSGRTPCYASVEDSVIVLGPPRAGKGLHLVIPMILDAPGAVITTSTRPDNLAATLLTRTARGPVAVFDPQGLAPGIPSATRWSPIRGCQRPHTALVRAKALTAGLASGTTDSTFWQASAEQAVRCLLHAAALGGRSSTDLYQWSLSVAHARDAAMILATHPEAAMSWHQALEAIINADQRQRDSVWAMVGIAFAPLADPSVLDALSPRPGEVFSPEEFLRSSGSIYLLGTSTGAAATSGLVGAFVEDVIEAARALAARSPSSRLDPPLSVVLDEAANYVLPSLASLMSDGGGTGISTVVVLQSLAQARAVWGEHQAGAIWDSAIVKVMLGGASNAKDLDDLSRLIGTRSVTQTSQSRGADGRSTTSTSQREVPVMEPARLRTLPFGTGVLLLRSAKPIHLTLQPWTERNDARQLLEHRATIETHLRGASSVPQPFVCRAPIRSATEAASDSEAAP